MRIQDVLRANVVTLLNRRGLTCPQIDNMQKKGQSPVTGRFVRQIITGERESPKIDKLADLAELFGLEAWQLLRPTLPQELDDRDLKALITDYLNATAKGREHIVQTARFTRADE